MKQKFTLAVLLLLIAVAVPLSAWWFLWRPLPPMDGTVPIAGLQGTVAVDFDAHGVPYIEARRNEDAWEALGYVAARDRLFQMDLLRRTALGNMAEIFGAGWLPTDRLMRTLSIRQIAFDDYDHLGARARSALEAYARGVNAYMENYNGRLPVEFTALGYTPTTWRPEDSLAILKCEAYKLDESWRLDDFRQRVSNAAGDAVEAALFKDDLVAYGLPPSPKQQAPASAGKDRRVSRRDAGGPQQDVAVSRRDAGGPQQDVAVSRRDAGGPQLPAELSLAQLQQIGDLEHQGLNCTALAGSTTWAVPGSATANGAALLACNKDGAFTSPSQWYLCSLNTPEMHTAGATIPGVPAIIVGRNENIAWGSSALKADVQDIFLEQFKSPFDPAYRTPTGWAAAEQRTEVIPVRLGKDVEHKIYRTSHGPVLLRSKDAGISLSWTGLSSEHPTYEALLAMDSAATTDEFVDALKKITDPPLLFVFADRHGVVGCHAAGVIPVRAGGSTGTKLNVGWESKGAWQATVAFDKLPQAELGAQAAVTTPPAVVAANQKPATAPGALPQAAPGVYLGQQWAPPYRANRLLTAIAAIASGKQPLTLADMALLQGDLYSALSPVVAESIADAGRSVKSIDRNGVFTAELLSKWDGQLRQSGTSGCALQSFLQTFTRRLVEPKLGRAMTNEYFQRWPLWLTLAHSVLENKPVAWLPPEERSYDCFMQTTLKQSLKSLRIAFDTTNPAEWIWGKIHCAVFYPLAARGSLVAGYYRLGPVPVGGAAECVNSCDVTVDPYALDYSARGGPTQRLLVDMSDHDKFYQSIATGQSGNLLSPYRKDQLNQWATVDLLPIAFSAEQTMRQSKHRLVLEPE